MKFLSLVFIIPVLAKYINKNIVHSSGHLLQLSSFVGESAFRKTFIMIEL